MFLVGSLSTQIRYNESSKRWVITDAVSKVRAESRASKVSYVLGKHNYTVTGDVFECHEGQPYTTILKMSGCNRDGEFTCDDGQCVTMEQRCDQIKDCIDGSDEMDCNLLVLEEGYKKEVTPFTLRTPGRTIKPAQVNVSINLLRIINMEEQDHKIDLQFQITLEWRETGRVLYHNLKEVKSMNALSSEGISKLWLPRVFYDNTDNKEVTRGGQGWEWPISVSIVREGSHDKRGSSELVDEVEIFDGDRNRIEMQQVYTIEFQCQYDLQYYPFDTQV